jgi:hypothetical protein
MGHCSSLSVWAYTRRTCVMVGIMIRSTGSQLMRSERHMFRKNAVDWFLRKRIACASGLYSDSRQFPSAMEMGLACHQASPRQPC